MTSSNFYFNNFGNSMEQDLIESLVVESISIYGHSVYYCPRTVIKKDDIYGEDTISEYNRAYEFDMYIRSFDNYEGDGTFLSKFNLEIRDQVRFTVARRTFYNEIGTDALIDRPQEGDLIFSPMMNRLFVIKYVKNTAVFYQLGSLQTWDITCEVFEYSSERLNTGIDAIDAIETKYSTNEVAWGILTDDGSFIVQQDGGAIIQQAFNFDNQNQDTYADNDEIQLEGEGIIDWTVIDPFSEGNV
jgi:hypothetical protein